MRWTPGSEQPDPGNRRKRGLILLLDRICHTSPTLFRELSFSRISKLKCVMSSSALIMRTLQNVYIYRNIFHIYLFIEIYSSFSLLTPIFECVSALILLLFCLIFKNY